MAVGEPLNDFKPNGRYDNFCRNRLWNRTGNGLGNIVGNVYKPSRNKDGVSNN